MKSTSVNIGDTATAQQYNNLRDDAKGGGFLLAHEQSSPNMTVKVEDGVAYIGATRVVYAGGNSPTMTAPSANPRIDLITIDSAGTIAVVNGAEAASPSVPAYPANKLVICEIYHRVSSTQIRDTDQGSNSYIQRDVRPFLGGAYIATDSQVDAAAAIQVSKIRKNSDIIPETDDAYDLGSSSFQFAEVRAKKIYKNNAEVGGKFGGDGSDGSKTVSANEDIDAAGSEYVVKNYTDFTINSTKILGLINPHGNGTVLHIKVSGNCTINGKINLKGLGGPGGNGSANSGAGSNGTQGNGCLVSEREYQDQFTQSGDDYLVNVWISQAGQRGGPGSPASQSAKASGGGAGGGGAVAGGNGGGTNINGFRWGGRGGLAVPALGRLATLSGKFALIACGGGGGGGGNSNNSNDGGNGSAGGGALLLEVGGDLTFGASSEIDISGNNGSAASGNTDFGAGGGGGGGGAIGKAVYAGTLTNSGLTKTVAGGSGGGGTGSSGSGGAGGAGSFDIIKNTEFA